MGKRRRAEPEKAAADENDEKEQQESGSEGAEAEPTSSDGGSSGSKDGNSGSEDGSSDGDSDSDGSSAPDVSSAEEDDGDEDDEDAYSEVDVEFQFFDPKEIDFHGLKALLHTFLDGEQYDGSGLADTIIAQVGRPVEVHVAVDDARLSFGAPGGHEELAVWFVGGEQWGGSHAAPSIPSSPLLPPRNIPPPKKKPQSTVGTAVKTGEDDDPIAVMTALNTQRYKDKECMGQIRAFLLKKCSDEAVRRQFEKVRAAGCGCCLQRRSPHTPSFQFTCCPQACSSQSTHPHSHPHRTPQRLGTPGARPC